LATETIQSHVFENGLVLVGELMDWLESAAFTLLVPAGAAHDPSKRAGLSNFTCEMVQRGCGSRSSRQFIEDLENRGVDHSAGTSVVHSSFSAAMLAEHLEPTLDIFSDLLLRPHLPPDQLEDGRSVCLQELRSLEDELAQRAFVELRRLHYPDPWGRSPYGKNDELLATTIEDIEAHFKRCYRPSDTILAVAGNFSWKRLVDHVGRLLGQWNPAQEPAFAEKGLADRYVHIPCDSSQTHLGIAYPSVPYSDPDFYNARGAVGVLSDGMSSRLFTEVRENRGLCYSIFASYHSLRDRGSVLCYAGTSTDRAQETLDVTLSELTGLRGGIRSDELVRLKARVKSALILQQESSLSRSSSLAGDWYYLERARSLDEVGKIIDGLTCDGINAYLAEHPPGDFSIVTLGEEPLEVDFGVSSPETG
jgi:predicted Zn-dependent peptidase